MQRTMSATEARIHFGELMRHVVEHQEPVIVEHSGKPLVVVISFEKCEQLLAAREEREDEEREDEERQWIANIQSGTTGTLRAVKTLKSSVVQ